MRKEFTDAFLREHGAAAYSKIIMTPSGYLTDEAWKKIVPFLILGLRQVHDCYEEMPIIHDFYNLRIDK